MLNHYFAALMITGITHAVFAIAVALRSSRKFTNLVFCLYSIAIACWAIPQSLAILALNASDAAILFHLSHVGVILVPVFVAHFVVSLHEAQQQERLKSRIYASYMVAAIGLVLNMGPVLIDGARPQPPLRFFLKPGILYIPMFILWVLWATYAIYLLFRLYHSSSGLKRNQLKYLCFSWLATYLCGVPNFLPAFGVQKLELMIVCTYMVPLNAVVTAYVLARYRIMDINVAMARTLVSMVVYGVLLGLPLVAAINWQGKLEILFGSQWWVWLWCIGVVLSTIANYVNTIAQRRAESRVFQEQRRYQNTLFQASQGMTQIRDLKRLLRLTVHVITKTVGLGHASIFLEDQQEENVFIMRARRYKRQELGLVKILSSDRLAQSLNKEKAPIILDELQAKIGELSAKEASPLVGTIGQMHAMNASVIVPSFRQGKLVGFLALGEKRSGKIFTEEDLTMFSTLANQSALAIENARFFEELEVQEARMFQSEKLASLGQLASGMAHEIHNPLTIISGEAQLYLESNRGSNKEVDSVLESIIDECHRAADITRRILRFAKPARAEFAEVDLRATVEESLQLAGYQVRFEKIDRKLNLPEDLPKVWGSQNQLQEVMLNLIINACQAMSEKGGLIEVSALQKADKIQLKVSDTGPGISRERLAKIFDPFFTTKHNGTGLGLFVTQRIVKAHSGTIQVDSTEGRGTTFTITLPTHAEGVGAKASAQASGRS